MPTFTPRYRIDWDADASTTDADLMTSMLAATEAAILEDVTPDVLSSPLTVIRYGRDQARELAPPMVGTSDFTLKNDDGRYSSQDSAGPLYGKLVAGRRIEVDIYYDGSVYPQSRTYTDEPEERPLKQQQNVRIYGLDGFSLMDADVYTDMFESIRSDLAIAAVLDAVGWPADKRNLDTGKTTFVRWWGNGRKAKELLKEIVFSEGLGALIYIVNDVVTFESRHFRFLTPRCTTPQATLVDQGAEPLMRAFSIVPGAASIVNDCSVKVRSFALGALGTIWTGPSPIVLTPGQVKTYTVSADGPGFDNAVDPTVGDGDFVVSVGSVVSATLDHDGGGAATLTIEAGPEGATITGLRVRGRVVSIAEQVVRGSIDTSASRLAHGVKGLPEYVSPVWIPTVGEAEDYCNAVEGRYQESVPQGTATLNNATDERLVQGLVRQVSDRVHLTDTGLSKFDDDVMIEAIERRFDSKGDSLEVTFYWERASDQAIWALGIAGYSELDLTTRLGY